MELIKRLEDWAKQEFARDDIAELLDRHCDDVTVNALRTVAIMGLETAITYLTQLVQVRHD